jgi:hypothetical protein
MASENHDPSGFENHKKSGLSNKTVDILLVLLVLVLGAVAFYLFFPRH